MSEILLASAPMASMRALAFKGITAFSGHAQIQDMVARKFDAAHAKLFSRPLENSATGAIDWYADAGTRPEPVAKLPENERADVLARLKKYSDDMGAYADELINTGDPLRVTRGNILKLALNYPDQNFVYAQGGEPVLAGWGFAKAAKGAPVASYVAQGEDKARSCAWLWLLPLLPAILLALLLFASFGPLPSLTGISLFNLPLPPFLEPLGGYEQKAQGMASEVAGLHARLGQHAALCKPEPVKEKNALSIPANATDPAFLQGAWLCETGLASRRSGERVQFAFSFDREGNGTGTVLEKNDQCEGKAKAKIVNGGLSIELGPQECARSGNIYESVKIECSGGKGGQTFCKGENADGSAWNAFFVRRQQP